MGFLLISVTLISTHIFPAEFCGYKVKAVVEIFRQNIKIAEFKTGVAQTPKEHEQGLMNCAEMSNNIGLLFIFDNDRERTFWMENTPLPLGILFIDKNMQIIRVASGKPFSRDSIPSFGKALFVLEINESASRIIQKGDYIKIR